MLVSQKSPSKGTYLNALISPLTKLFLKLEYKSCIKQYSKPPLHLHELPKNEPLIHHSMRSGMLQTIPMLSQAPPPITISFPCSFPKRTLVLTWYTIVAVSQFWTLCKYKCKAYISLCLASLAQHLVCEIHSFAGWSWVNFLCSIVLHCLIISTVFVHSIISNLLHYFPSGNIMNNAAVNILVDVFHQT